MGKKESAQVLWTCHGPLKRCLALHRSLPPHSERNSDVALPNFPSFSAKKLYCVHLVHGLGEGSEQQRGAARAQALAPGECRGSPQSPIELRRPLVAPWHRWVSLRSAASRPGLGRQSAQVRRRGWGGAISLMSFTCRPGSGSPGSPRGEAGRGSASGAARGPWGSCLECPLLTL